MPITSIRNVAPIRVIRLIPLLSFLAAAPALDTRVARLFNRRCFAAHSRSPRDGERLRLRGLSGRFWRGALIPAALVWFGMAVGVRTASASGCHVPDRVPFEFTPFLIEPQAANPIPEVAVDDPRDIRIVPQPCPSDAPRASGRTLTPFALLALDPPHDWGNGLSHRWGPAPSHNSKRLSVHRIDRPPRALLIDRP
jgi:hypothetical protein